MREGVLLLAPKQGAFNSQRSSPGAVRFRMYSVLIDLDFDAKGSLCVMMNWCISVCSYAQKFKWRVIRNDVRCRVGYGKDHTHKSRKRLDRSENPSCKFFCRSNKQLESQGCGEVCLYERLSYRSRFTRDALIKTRNL